MVSCMSCEEAARGANRAPDERRKIESMERELNLGNVRGSLRVEFRARVGGDADGSIENEDVRTLRRIPLVDALVVWRTRVGPNDQGAAERHLTRLVAEALGLGTASRARTSAQDCEEKEGPHSRCPTH